MKLDAGKFGLAAGVVTAIIWVLCSVIVAMMPGMAMNVSGSMMHADFSGMTWHMGFTGFLVGLVVWSVLVGLFAWLMAVIYNRMV